MTADRPASPQRRPASALRVFAACLFLALAFVIAAPRAVLAQPLQQITGVWRGIEGVPGAMTQVEVIFFPNGTYSRTHTMGMLMTRDSGRYEVVQNWIHFSLQTWSPTEYQGRQLSWPTSETWVVQRYDGRVLETANIHIERVQ